MVMQLRASNIDDSEFPFFSNGYMSIHYNGIETIVMTKHASRSDSFSACVVVENHIIKAGT
jgi:hypothetical protein